MTNQSSVSNLKSVNRKNILFHLNPSTKSIIPYGLYQSSGIGFGKALPHKVYSMYGLTPFLHSMVLGLLLGEGWFEKNNSSFKNISINARFGLKQGLININFILFVFNLLSPFCWSMPVLSNSTRLLHITVLLLKQELFHFLRNIIINFMLMESK